MLRKCTIDIVWRDIRLRTVRVNKVMNNLVPRAIGEVLKGRYIPLIGVLRFGCSCRRGTLALTKIGPATARASVVAVVVIGGG